MADARIARRLRLARDMYEFGEQAQRSRLRRRRPTARDEEIKAELRRWRVSLPGALHGDAAGRSSRRFT